MAVKLAPPPFYSLSYASISLWVENKERKKRIVFTQIEIIGLFFSFTKH